MTHLPRSLLCALTGSKANIDGVQTIVRNLHAERKNQKKLVVILVVLTRLSFWFSLPISQLMAKAIPVRGAIFKKPA
ncbi:hypothetical protein FNV34_17405 [Raoultella ornithinolytica]|nr:hypothetical protein FNV34_17405 [Raoultella ornithinolytica]